MDIAIEFLKDVTFEKRGREKTILKGTKMVCDKDFAEQFIKAKQAKDISVQLENIKKETEKIIDNLTE